MHVHRSIKNFGKLLIEHDQRKDRLFKHTSKQSNTTDLIFSVIDFISWRSYHERRISNTKVQEAWQLLISSSKLFLIHKKKLRINRMSLFCSVCLVSFCQFFCLWMRKIFEEKIRIKPVKALGRNHEKRSQKIVIEIMIIIKEYLDLWNKWMPAKCTVIWR